jgi:hypothetical protein
MSWAPSRSYGTWIKTRGFKSLGPLIARDLRHLPPRRIAGPIILHHPSTGSRALTNQLDRIISPPFPMAKCRPSRY